MIHSSDTSRPSAPSQKDKLVTSRLFEAYLACVTKCYLRSTGIVATGNAFTNWVQTRSASYIREVTKNFTAGLCGEFVVSYPEASQWKTAQWHWAVDQVVRAQGLEASIHAIQRIPPDRTDKSSQFVPIRFVHKNKLSRADKLMAGFDAYVFSKILGGTGQGGENHPRGESIDHKGENRRAVASSQKDPRFRRDHHFWATSAGPDLESALHRVRVPRPLQRESNRERRSQPPR